jgi:hypothetical protein
MFPSMPTMCNIALGELRKALKMYQILNRMQIARGGYGSTTAPRLG